MDFAIVIEIFGTTASVIVAISLMMKEIRRLRIINAVGAFFFAVYGGIIGAWPVFGLNFFIVCVDIYFLWQMAKKHDAFELLTVDVKDAYLASFLRFWLEDIHKFVPAFAQKRLKEDVKACFVLRDAVPVTLVIYRELEPGIYQIDLDYATPEYRDMQNSRFFFAKLKADSVHTSLECLTTAQIPAHLAYLKRMGYTEAGMNTEGEMQFRLVL